MFDTFTAEARRILQQKFGQDTEDVRWSMQRESGRGDIATSVALSFAKQLKKDPKAVAKVLADGLSKLPFVEKAEVAGAGYVNLWLKPSVLLAHLEETRSAIKPQPIDKKKPPVIIDYCGPNIAKPLGAHHLGPHFIGQAIINIYKHTGVHTIGWSYPGDWGTQFGKLAVAHRLWGDKKSSAYSVEELLALYVRFHEEAEKNPALEDEARAVFTNLEGGDKQVRAFWKDVVATSYVALDALYERLHIHIDVVTGESFYEDKMESILEEGVKKGVFTKGENGALIVSFPEDTGLPPLLVRKSDGSTLYATRDLAMIRYRIDTYHPSALYYVVDVAQSLHFQQLEATCRLLGWQLPAFEHTVFGRMRFQGASMSTRKGTSIRMEQLIEEAVRRAEALIAEHGDTIQTDDPKALAEMMGIGALAYGILSQNRKMDIVFDWDKMLSFEGNSAPYLQYTHARARSVLRKAEGAIAGFPADVPPLTDSERLLLRTLIQFPSVVDAARDTRMPHKLTNWLFQLAQDFNAFYNNDPILKAAEPARAFRLALTAQVADALKTGAELLTLRVPDKM